MAGITDWTRALGDVRFWATHYGGVQPKLFGLPANDVEEYACLLCNCEGHPEWLGDEELAEELGDALEGSTLDIPCPDGSVLVVGFTIIGTFFSLQPPGSNELVPIGSMEGNFISPTWSWEELLQLDAWLRRSWRAAFQPAALLPLLLPQASLSAPHTEEGALEVARPVLSSAWRELEIVPNAHLTQAVDEAVRTELHWAYRWWHHPQHGWLTDAPHALPRHESPAFLRFLDAAARGVAGS